VIASTCRAAPWEYFASGRDVLANEFIFGGIFDRFPKLKVMCSEFEVSWLPYWLFRIKQVQRDFGPALGIPKINRPVTEYWARSTTELSTTNFSTGCSMWSIRRPSCGAPTFPCALHLSEDA